MGDPSKSQTPNFYGILGIPKSASLSDICKAYKFLVMKWHPDRNPSNKVEAEAKFSSINEAYRALSIKKREEANACNEDHEQKTHQKKKSTDYEKDKGSNGDGQELKISSPKLLSRTTSQISPLPSPTFSSSLSRRSTTPPPMDFYASFPKTSSGGNTPTTPSTPKEPTSLSTVASRRCTTPIFFSQSVVRRKPPPVEKKLECTLEELCHGCVKKIKITRDAISSSGHPLFKREGDDLELGVEVPLVQALTGCTVPVPLLGGGQITLSIDDIIYPGYEKIIPGQGMPTSKDGKRGDLKLKFLVEFPTELSNDQRSEVVSILQECS